MADPEDIARIKQMLIDSGAARPMVEAVVQVNKLCLDTIDFLREANEQSDTWKKNEEGHPIPPREILDELRDRMSCLLTVCTNFGRSIGGILMLTETIGKIVPDTMSIHNDLKLHMHALMANVEYAPPRASKGGPLGYDVLFENMDKLRRDLGGPN